MDFTCTSSSIVSQRISNWTGAIIRSGGVHTVIGEGALVCSRIDAFIHICKIRVWSLPGSVIAFRNYPRIYFHISRHYMAEILPIRRKTLFNQSINIRMTKRLHTNASLLVLSIQRKACFTKAVTNWRIGLILFATIATVQCRKQRTYVRNWKKHENYNLSLIHCKTRGRERDVDIDGYLYYRTFCHHPVRSQIHSHSWILRPHWYMFDHTHLSQRRTRQNLRDNTQGWIMISQLNKYKLIKCFKQCTVYLQ